ncbi:MAG: ribosome recycling factor [Anaerolineae bacterium]|jgi:ribosome recycling factor|nr:ribosome recycling factor [Anaerolineae bacterium]MDH7473740.1 ribosome recycling factor [Anaerolineae bacterium]
MINDVLKEVEDRMNKAVDALREDLLVIRTGRASPALIERLPVEYYGSLTPLNQLATIAAPEPRLLTVRPWDAAALPAIEKAILKSDLGLTPSNDGKIIRLVIPRLTEKRRNELAKIVAQRVEEGRVAIRHCRRDAIEDLRELEKEKLISEDDFYRGRDEVQKLTDRFIAIMDEMGQRKVAEIKEI